MKVEILIIGNELLGGSHSDANGLFLANFLKKKGVSLSKMTILPDEKRQIEHALSQGIKYSDIVFLSGGLGPTNDDMTKKVLADFFSTPLKEDDLAESFVRKHYERISRRWNKQNGYHLIPQGFAAVFNEKGLAPGLVYRKGKKCVLAAPGVPWEFASMVEKEFFPWLLKNASGFAGTQKRSMTIRTWGIPEEKIFHELVPELWSKLEKWGKVASLPHVMGVDIVISALDNEWAQKEVEKFLSSTPLHAHIWQIGTVPLNEWVLQKAREKNLTVVLAESCTGGLLSSRLTDVSGSSLVFKGGVVAYSNTCKQKMLGVKERTLKDYGPISKETAVEMAIGVRKLLQGDIALSLCGVAGPGKREGISEGTLVIGLDNRGEAKGELLQMKGDRMQLKERFVQKGLYTLLSMIENHDQ